MILSGSALVLLAFGATHPAPAELAGPADAPDEGPPRVEATDLPLLSYGELAADPAQTIGRRVRVNVQVHSIEERWNPYLTRFGAREFLAVRAWSDEQTPWILADYENPVARLFVRRGGWLATTLAQARPHERFEVVCIVREFFGRQLWSEIVEARRLPEYVPEGTILHATRALDLMGKQAFGMASAELGRALEAPLPEAAYDALLELRKHCTARQATGKRNVVRVERKL